MFPRGLSRVVTLHYCSSVIFLTQMGPFFDPNGSAGQNLGPHFRNLDPNGLAEIWTQAKSDGSEKKHKLLFWENIFGTLKHRNSKVK